MSLVAMRRSCRSGWGASLLARPAIARSAIVLLIVLANAACPAVRAAAPPNVFSIRQDLTTPPVTKDAPGPGRRVKQTTAGWEGTWVYHALYLPRNWKAGGSYPVLFEYGGNGGFQDAYGDTCRGTVEGCNLGYGLSGGVDYIWVCLPFVRSDNGLASNATFWWGDPSETARYCVATVHQVCSEFGGDPKRVVLCGFSRGAIACNYIGLRDDTIASLWKAFICHSHYDGVRMWHYADSDRASALIRLNFACR